MINRNLMINWHKLTGRRCPLLQKIAAKCSVLNNKMVAGVAILIPN
jgi:hypothetical protein